MASNAGALVVSLGLNAAEFFAGMTKSEVQAKKFARTLEVEVAGAANLLKGALAGITVGSLIAAFDRAVEGAAKFKQLSEEIGDTAEAIGGLQTAANTSGVAINDIASASVRLTAALSKTDDESKGAGAAIKALGLNFAQFKALSPVTQLESVANAMARFEDGAGKTAVAVALFGKAGAQLIPFLNDLAEQGGRNVRLTQEQIDAADRFAKELGALKGEIALVAQAIAVDMIPTISRLIKEFTDGIRIAGGFGEALRIFGLGIGTGGIAENIAKVTAEIERLEKSAKKDFGPLKAFNEFRDEALPGLLSDARKKLEFLRAQQRQAALGLIGPGNEDQNDRRNRRPTLVADLGGDAAKKTTAALKERTSEAERYLESLEKQLEKTQELSVAEQLWLDFSKGRIKDMTAAQFAQADVFARQIDASKEAKRVAEEQKKAEEEAARARERREREIARSIESSNREAQSIRGGNERLKEEAIFLKGGELALRAYTDAKLAAAVAESKHKTAMEAAKVATEGEIKALEGITAALEETQAALLELDIAKKFADEAKNLQEVKNLFSDALTDPLADFVTGTKSAKDAFKSFADDLTRQLTRIASQNLANAIFGGNNSSGPDWMSVFGKFLGAFAGGGSGAGYELGSLANGTNSWRGGPTMVGEREPEIINLPRGASVTPISQAKRAGQNVTVNQYLTIMPGASTASVRQAKAQLRDATLSAMRNR